MRTYRFVIGTAEAGLRLDHYLVRRLPAAVSRSMIQRGVREGAIMIGERRAKAHQKLRVGDAVTAMFTFLPAPSKGVALTPQALPLDIAYEDDVLLVVNKPAGLVTHPAPGHWDGTLVNAILWHLQQQSAQGWGLGAGGKGSRPEPRAQSPDRPLQRAGIVHRLDKDTSGLLLVAKTDIAHAALSKQLKARTIRRRYLALVEGHLPMDAGTIDIPIGRHLTHRKEMTIRHMGGRSAITHYRVLKRYGKALRAQDSGLRASALVQSPEPPAQSDFPCTVMEVSLDTGRTHQIRVHMAHLGHPVVGDTTYGRHSAGYWQSAGIPRHLLHAYRLSFRHPAGGRRLTVTAPIPDDMKAWVPADIAQDLAALQEGS